MPPSLAGFDTGLFLPRGGYDWFGRPSYPPRLLLLAGGALHIVSHPSAGEPPRQCAMEQVSSVESGHMLLKGWLRFTGSGFDYTVRYNTRGFPTVFRFMRRFQDKLLPRSTPRGASEVRLGPSLDIKFANALALELGSEETVLIQLFQPPGQVRSGSCLLRHRRWVAGDLLALTGRRLLWITDRERGSYWRYASIASYAPLDAVQSIGLASGRAGHILRVELNGGCAWQVPIASGSREEWQRIAEDFAAAASMVRTS
ncbi:MAG: hypothetical protein ABSC05_05315 [Candidatus Solibacter sp.]